MSPPLSRQRCSELCPGWQHPLACPSLPGAPQGAAALAEVGWDWPEQPGSARQGFQKAPHHCHGQEWQRVKFPLQQSHPAAQGCSLLHPWLSGLSPSPGPGRGSDVPCTAWPEHFHSYCQSIIESIREGESRKAAWLPLHFPSPSPTLLPHSPSAPEPASGSQVQPDGTAAQSLNAWNRHSREFWTGEFILRSLPVKSSIVSKFQTSFH